MTQVAISAVRYHDISCGHRVAGHENKCKNLHGHNYRVTFHCRVEELDEVGRVIDFGVIKQRLCLWLEDNWDHRMLIWEKDPWQAALTKLDSSVLLVPFNPTAEEMARFLLSVVGPQQLKETGVTLTHVIVEETRKCSAEAWLEAGMSS